MSASDPDVYEEPSPPRVMQTVARGIVWADIVADIERDQRERELRAAEAQEYPDAA